MIELPLIGRCRLSGEDLAQAETWMDLHQCPLPGIYPQSPEESVGLISPLRVVRAPGSGLVQLAHTFDSAMYKKYAFAGGVSASYRAYLARFAREVATTFPSSASVLEIGCGDGQLLRCLQAEGFRELLGVDPSRAAEAADPGLPVVRGYFPDDLPPAHRGKRFDVILLRHVLEHIEQPLTFLGAFEPHLAEGGELWIEVPDLESAIRQDLWSNFYQLHCTYFDPLTLDRTLARVGFAAREGRVVDIFGGSLLRKYRRGTLAPGGAPAPYADVRARIAMFQDRLQTLAERLPAGTVGLGAAERTAVTFGLCPELARRLSGLHDGNPHLTGRYLAGTELRIDRKESLATRRPPAVVLLALSYVQEMVHDLQAQLPGSTWVGVAGHDFAFQTLDQWPRA